MELAVSRLYGAIEMLNQTRYELAKASLEFEEDETISPEMVAAGERAGREYFERTGGNSPTAIYLAMRIVAIQQERKGSSV